VVDFIAQYWLEVLFSLLAGIMAGLYRRLSSRMKERAREQDLVREGVLALLHDRLYSACEALIQKGSCEVTEMKNLEYLYKTYHSLGGNGTGTELFERVKNLQLK
jgi:hypothetical protein